MPPGIYLLLFGKLVGLSVWLVNISISSISQLRSSPRFSMNLSITLHRKISQTNPYSSSFLPSPFPLPLSFPRVIGSGARPHHRG